jgi:hypothetical protein
LAIVTFLFGCQTTSLPSPELKAAFDARTAAAASARDGGKITWTRWAYEANDALRAYLGPQSLEVEALLAKRVYWASEVDAKRMTPEAFDAAFTQEAAKRAQRQ